MRVDPLNMKKPMRKIDAKQAAAFAGANKPMILCSVRGNADCNYSIGRRQRAPSSSLTMIPEYYSISLSATIPESTISEATLSTTAGDALSSQDILVGTILGFILAFGYSFLNGQSSSASFISWPSQHFNINADGKVEKDGSSEDAEGVGDKEVVFGSDNWKEMSREENYVLYNTKIRQKSTKQKVPSQNNREKRLVLVALLVLFVPIFSIEFFFALSRLFLCEMGTQGDLAQKLCSPIVS